MVCFFTQSNGKKPLLGKVQMHGCNILGNHVLQVDCYGTPGCRSVVKRLKKLGVDGVATTPVLPERLKNTLADEGFTIFNGKKLMALMLPDILRMLQKNHGLDSSVPIVVYGDATRSLCRRAVYDAVQYSRQVCLVGPPRAEMPPLLEEVFAETGQTVSLYVPQKPHIAVYCGVQGRGAVASVNLEDAPMEGAVNSLVLTASDGMQLDMAVAEGALGEGLTAETVRRSGIKIKFFG